MQVHTPFGSFELEKGDLIGLLDIYVIRHSYSYKCKTDVNLSYIAFDGPNSLAELLSDKKDLLSLSSRSMIRQISFLLDLVQYVQYEAANCHHFLVSTYNDYKSFSDLFQIPFKPLPEFDFIQDPNIDEPLNPWLLNYYQALQSFVKEEPRFFEKNSDLTAGLLLNYSKDALEILDLGSVLIENHKLIMQYIVNPNQLDFFDLYSDLYIRVSKERELIPAFNSSFAQLVNYISTAGQIDSAYWEKRYEKYERDLTTAMQKKDLKENVIMPENNLANSLDQILNFSECSQEMKDTFKTSVSKYLKMKDRTDTSDDATRLYKELTLNFNEIYTSIFQLSLMEEILPKVVRMFLYFGYIDENLCGIENAKFLYDNIDFIKSNEKHGIYTLYDWLKAIYQGKKEPSRNEFEIDYSDYIHELRARGKINKQTEDKMKEDSASKVMYELNNMFPSANKVTNGKISCYTPLLSEHNFLRPLQELFLSESDIYKALNEIAEVDYSAYCREILYSNPSIGIQKEYIQTEILPDIILMPNCGTRGIMWQEIEGKRRNTPARMMLPILAVNELEPTLLRLTGEFRWEMCKRVQGSRWNDISEKSLTSVYFDYIQFYKKNSNLSPEIKTKIKLSLGRARNSFKEAFIQDYIAYMSFEKNGIPKLNKVTRNIFFEFCPFTKNYREKLGRNPLYAEGLNTYALHIKQSLRRFELIEKKFVSNNQKLPAEIRNQISFLNK